MIPKKQSYLKNRITSENRITSQNPHPYRNLLVHRKTSGTVSPHTTTPPRGLQVKGVWGIQKQ